MSQLKTFLTVGLLLFCFDVSAKVTGEDIRRLETEQRLQDIENKQTADRIDRKRDEMDASLKTGRPITIPEDRDVIVTDSTGKIIGYGEEN